MLVLAKVLRMALCVLCLCYAGLSKDSVQNTVCKQSGDISKQTLLCVGHCYILMRPSQRWEIEYQYQRQGPMYGKSKLVFTVADNIKVKKGGFVPLPCIQPQKENGTVVAENECGDKPIWVFTTSRSLERAGGA